MHSIAKSGIHQIPHRIYDNFVEKENIYRFFFSNIEGLVKFINIVLECLSNTVLTFFYSLLVKEKRDRSEKKIDVMKSECLVN